MINDKNYSRNINKASPLWRGFETDLYYSGVDDESDELYNFVRIVCDGVAGAGGADGDIASGDDLFFACITVYSGALDYVEQLGVLLVDVVADAAAGVKGDLAEEAALFVKLCCVAEIGDLDSAVAFAHFFAVFYLAFFCFSDHDADLLM